MASNSVDSTPSASTDVKVTDYVADFRINVDSLLTWLNTQYPEDTACADLKTEVTIILGNRDFTAVFMNEWLRHMAPHTNILGTTTYNEEQYVALVETIEDVPALKTIRPKAKFLHAKFTAKKKAALLHEIRKITASAIGFMTESTEGKSLAKLLNLANKFATQFKLEDLRSGKIQTIMTAIPDLLKGEETLSILSGIVGNDGEFEQFISFIEMFLGGTAKTVKIPDMYKGAIRQAIHQYTKVVAQVDFSAMLDAMKPHLNPIFEAGSVIFQELETAVAKNGSDGIVNLMTNLAGQFLGGTNAEGSTYTNKEGKDVFSMMKTAKAEIDKRFSMYGEVGQG